MGGGKKQTIGFQYLMGLQMVVCKGPINALLEIRNECRRRDVELQLVRVSPRVLEVLRLTGVAPVFDLEES